MQMKVTLSILLGVSLLLNILLVGCHFSNHEVRTVEYDGPVLSEEQMKILMHREKEIYPEICDTIDQYQIFIRNIKGKQLVVMEQ